MGLWKISESKGEVIEVKEGKLQSRIFKALWFESIKTSFNEWGVSMDKKEGKKERGMQKYTNYKHQISLF